MSIISMETRGSAEPCAGIQRPRLLPGLPVLLRDVDEAQVGTDPRHAVVIGGLTPALLRRLRTLDGSLTYQELLGHTAPEDRSRLVDLLTRLTQSRLLEDAADDGSVVDTTRARIAADSTVWALRTGRPRSAVSACLTNAAVVVHGDGRVAVAVSCLLATAGIGWVHTPARGRVRPQDCGTGYLEADIGCDRAGAAERAVEQMSGSVRTAPMPPSRAPDLVVLADAAVPDPQLVASLSAAGTRHLVVRVREGTGWVGPMVVPGRTSCLRCLDLHRTDRDPCWPQVAAQLAVQEQPADLFSANAVASFAACQVVRALGGESPVLWNSALELDPFNGTVRRREWSPHPNCGCGAGPQARTASKQEEPAN